MLNYICIVFQHHQEKKTLRKSYFSANDAKSVKNTVSRVLGNFIGKYIKITIGNAVKAQVSILYQ